MVTYQSPFVQRVTAHDGTSLAAWTNDPDLQRPGPTIFLCNGLGANAWFWPALLREDCEFRVVSWDHRGTGRSDRPRDRRRRTIADFTSDALCVMDAFELQRPVVVGWSMGVNVAFEIQRLHPDRVAGIMAIAGLPGDTFATMLGPGPLPASVRRAVTVNGSRVMSLAGRAITPVLSRVPVPRLAAQALAHSGFMLPGADPEVLTRALRIFRLNRIDWYFALAVSLSKHPRVSLSAIDVPVAYLAGTWDVLAGAREMGTAADRTPGATYDELPGSHFLPLEHEAEVADLLRLFLTKVHRETQCVPQRSAS